MPIPNRLRFEVLQRDGFACRYCGARPPGVVLHVDHIHPKSKGGKDELDNLMAACATCNQGKRAEIVDGTVAPPPIPENLAVKVLSVTVTHLLDMIQPMVADDNASLPDPGTGRDRKTILESVCSSIEALFAFGDIPPEFPEWHNRINVAREKAARGEEWDDEQN